MKQKSELRQQQEQESQIQQESKHEGREFESVEELIRFDAAQHNPPASVEQRIKASIEVSAEKNDSFWQRLAARIGFGRKK